MKPARRPRQSAAKPLHVISPATTSEIQHTLGLTKASLRNVMRAFRAAGIKVWPTKKTPTRGLSSTKRIVAQMQTMEGGAWSEAELWKTFGLTSAAIRRRRKEHRIVYWRDDRAGYFYPRWQFTETGALLPSIREVLQMFRSQAEWRVMRYFLGQRKQLNNRRPLDLLRVDEIETVLDHARSHAAENMW